MMLFLWIPSIIRHLHNLMKWGEGSSGEQSWCVPLEVPQKCMTSDNQHDKSNMIDLSFARECVEQMLLNMQINNEISPTRQIIVNRFDEDNRRPSNFEFSDQKSAEQSDAVCPDDVGFDGDGYDHEYCTAWNGDYGDQTGVVDEGPIGADSSFPSYPQVQRFILLQKTGH